MVNVNNIMSFLCLTLTPLHSKDGHVVTDVNPSYRVHNILNTDLYESQNKKEIEVQDYCEPEPSNRTTLSYTHTYNNDTNNRICFQQSESIYEDMYTL